ncbi:DUF294 nucleotidyltransferase-like domain-containing protein [Polaribacter sp. R77954]|uniref:DUF294 nucleotidyltransferase-like domain-containing protein n=1 Tax=Polaribacter sp. R77954 TaxID=3093870 RepID=UPI0037C9D318
MKNTIAERILDFLKNYPPFYFLNTDELLEISKEIEVIYLDINEVLFTQQEHLKKFFYVVKDGAVGLFHQNKLVDKCDEGDVFGLRAFVQNDVYALDAKAIEESILYCIPLTIFGDIIQKHEKVMAFLSVSFATNTRNTHLKKNNAFDLALKPNLKKNLFTEVQHINYSTKPITCQENHSIKEAALKMSDYNVGSILITKDHIPLGIITDKDLRNKVATGKYSIDDKVTQIMSYPVLTYPKNLSVSEAQIAMLKHNISHLCITKDGTNTTKIIGVLSEHDIVITKGNNPSVLIKALKKASTLPEIKTIIEKAQVVLKNYIEQHIPLQFVTNIISEINYAITRKIIAQNLQYFEQEIPVKFTWLTIGSQGRREQLLQTDQDNAIVFEDPEKLENTRAFFIKLATKINQDLAFVGFELCPAKMMAMNPKWCLSVTEWKQQFNDWITQPSEAKILLSTIFFDFNFMYGERTLADNIAKSIFESIHNYDLFLTYLGRNALQNPPPLSFFRSFLVEDTGEHKHQFDIKARAIMPLVDAARVLILSHAIKNINNTKLRFEKLSELEPQNKDLYEACSIAFETLLYFRTEEGLKNNNSGRFIDIVSLSKANRLQLKNCFKPIKELQDLIQTRFKLSQFL